MRPSPPSLSAGKLDILGLNVKFSDEPTLGGNYYKYFEDGTALFEPGADITARFYGEEVPGFSMMSTGVQMLEPSFAEDGVFLQKGTDNLLSWTPSPMPEGIVQLDIAASQNYHGGLVQDIIWCQGQDDGELTIHEEVLEDFPVGGTLVDCNGLDCPVSSFSRLVRRDFNCDADGQSTFIVGSKVYFQYLITEP